ncbi:MAG: PorP/SprF family type IX secretion system membrane protein [Bacteroidales bacterium]|nr:PorP/SprF family type IX secretion system membrane protein [Bacteroidales bacterium]
MNFIKKLIQLFLTLSTISLLPNMVAVAQLNPRSTLYSFHQSSYNPAICGAFDYGSASMVIRNQYMGFKDKSGPSTSWFDVAMPINSIKSGVGLSIAQTKEGFEKHVSAKLNYSYQLELGTGKLGFGLSTGLNNASWDLSSAIYPDGSSDSYIDKTIGSQERFTNLLLGCGLFYQTGGLYAAFAVSELNQPKLKSDSEKSDYMKRHYWLSAGYEYKTASPLWVICPSMTLKTTFSDWQASFDLRAVYKNLIIAGLSYTSAHDVSLNAGVQFKNGTKLDGLKAIFAYDLVTSKIGTESAGNLEFMISYDFNLFIEKENKSYKSVRFL